MNSEAANVSVIEYATPDPRRSFMQIINTFVPYFMLWAVAILSIKLEYHYSITLVAIILAAIFFPRIFIIFHDCCHTAFFSSPKANRIFGTILGVLTFTPYYDWAHEHLTHHSTIADLDRRGVGDIWTLTVKEYREASKWTKFNYRLARNPFILFGLGPIWVFLISHRFFQKGTGRKEKMSVLITNLSLLAICVVASMTIGLKTFLMIQLPIIYLGGVAGLWVFYVQHQFDPTHWYRNDEWDFRTASLYSSSYYKLPKVFQWLTGNIGLHHVHHFNARIPNYHLQDCLDNTPILKAVEPLSFMDSLRTVRLHLWDEDRGKLVAFGSLRSAD